MSEALGERHLCGCGCGGTCFARFIRGHFSRVRQTNRDQLARVLCVVPFCDVDWGPLFHRHCTRCGKPCSVNHRTCGECMAAMVADPMGYCQVFGHEAKTLLCDVCNLITTRRIQRAMGEPEYLLARIPRVDDEQGSHGELGGWHRNA